MCEWHLLSLKLTKAFQGKKNLPKNEAFDSQDTKPFDCLDTLFIISNNYDGEVLRMRNHA